MAVILCVQLSKPWSLRENLLSHTTCECQFWVLLRGPLSRLAKQLPFKYRFPKIRSRLFRVPVIRIMFFLVYKRGITVFANTPFFGEAGPSFRFYPPVVARPLMQ